MVHQVRLEAWWETERCGTVLIVVAKCSSYITCKNDQRHIGYNMQKKYGRKIVNQLEHMFWVTINQKNHLIERVLLSIFIE